MQAEPCAKLAIFSSNNSIPLSHRRESQRRKIMKWLDGEGLGGVGVGMSKVRRHRCKGESRKHRAQTDCCFLNPSSHQGRGD